MSVYFMLDPQTHEMRMVEGPLADRLFATGTTTDSMRTIIEGMKRNVRGGGTHGGRKIHQ